ncbi:hypothetical protein AVEN_229022-1 [Araneus ventricosus]|uniref:MATH domain-containing protein n=1 Tax=Araneus ventricosus TaxID=182803 RepID=A0A4Y2KP42_ARAVE|nr:hypothetical protein AVEN_229022-1 [Araneus ventricosus]
MAASNFSASQVAVQQHSQSNGHDIRYDFSLYNAAALQQDWTFTQDYRAPCVTAPTSWRFEMTLHRDPNSGVVSGNAMLQRTDTVNTPVCAHFVVTFRQNAFSLDFVPRSNVLRRIEPGDRKLTYIHVPKELLHGEILVVLHISVRKCHQDRKKGVSTPGAGVERKEMHCSKM